MSLLVAAAGSLSVAVGPVRAQAPAAETRSEATAAEKKQFSQFVQAGKEEYSAGNFEKAVPFFEQAYEIIPVPDLHYRIALSHERAGHPNKAIEHYRAFLEAKPETSKRGAVEETLARLEKETKAVVRIESSPKGARTYVRPAGANQREAEARGETPIELEVGAGDLEIILKKEGYRTRRETIEAEPGARYQYAWELIEAGSAGGGNGLTVASAIVGGVGVLSYGAFYGLGKYCQSNRQDCRPGLYSTSVVGSYAGSVLGIAGTVTALSLWQFGGNGRGPAQHGTRQLELRVTVTPGGLELTGTF